MNSTPNFDGKECYDLVDRIFKELPKKSFSAKMLSDIIGFRNTVEVCQLVLDQMVYEGKLECGPDPERKVDDIIYASKEAYIDGGR